MEDGDGARVELALFEPDAAAAAELAGLAPLTPRVATIVINTSHGPVLVLLWVVDGPQAAKLPRLLHEHQLDPFDTAGLALYSRLIAQPRWRLHVVGPPRVLLGVNDFDCADSLKVSFASCVAAAGPQHPRDFERARDEVARSHTPQALLRLAARGGPGLDAAGLTDASERLRAAVRRKDVERIRRVGQLLHAIGGVVALEAAHDHFIASFPRSRKGPALIAVTWRGIGAWSR